MTIRRWSCSRRRAPHDAHRARAGSRGADAGAGACLPLVPQDLGGGVYRLLPGDRTFPADLSLDRVLGGQLLRRLRAGVAPVLGQHVRARRHQRPGGGEPVYLVRRDIPPAALRETLVYRLLLLVIALIVYGSLYPWHFDFDRSNTNPLWVLLHAWPQGIDRWALRDAATNLLLYFPLGMAAFLAAARRHGRLVAFDAALLIALGLSTSMEMLQIYDPGRTCSLFDVFCNVSGAAAGAAAALVFHPGLASLARRKPGRHGSAGLLLAACWASYQLYPFFPLLSQTKLRASIEILVETASFSAVEIWANAAGWMAAALAMEAFLGRMRPRWLLAAMACLPLRLFIAERSLTLNEALGAALALLLWGLLPERKRLT